jgi:hypothetical protein
MNVTVNMSRLSRQARVYLRAVADWWMADTRMDHSARVIAARRIGFAEKSSTLAEASVRRKLRGRTFVLASIAEVAALEGFVIKAVQRLDDYGSRGRTTAVARELHRFARVHHLANILEMNADAA